MKTESIEAEKDYLRMLMVILITGCLLILSGYLVIKVERTRLVPHIESERWEGDYIYIYTTTVEETYTKPLFSLVEVFTYCMCYLALSMFILISIIDKKTNEKKLEKGDMKYETN